MEFSGERKFAFFFLLEYTCVHTHTHTHHTLSLSGTHTNEYSGEMKNPHVLRIRSKEKKFFFHRNGLTFTSLKFYNQVQSK